MLTSDRSVEHDPQVVSPNDVGKLFVCIPLKCFHIVCESFAAVNRAEPQPHGEQEGQATCSSARRAVAKNAIESKLDNSLCHVEFRFGLHEDVAPAA